jgi:hypothetical protein
MKMSEEEKASPWKKQEQQASLSDDHKDRFDRHQEVVDAQRRNTTAHDARVQHREENRARWTKQTAPPTAAGGTPLSPDVAALKRASDADREQRRTKTQATVPFIAPTVATITAIVNGWKTQTPNGLSYFDSAFNHRNMTLRVREQFELGHLIQWSVEALDEAFTFLLANNYLETPFKTAAIHPRGQSAPKPYPYVMPEEAAEEAERERIEDIHKTTEEIERAFSLPFDDLQKEVRYGFKSTAAGVVNVGERVR